MVQAYSMGVQKRMQYPKTSHEEAPGPGAYNSFSKPKDTAPQWSVGKSPRPPMLGNLSTPGPGEYKPPQKTFEGP